MCNKGNDSRNVLTHDQRDIPSSHVGSRLFECLFVSQEYLDHFSFDDPNGVTNSISSNYLDTIRSAFPHIYCNTWKWESIPFTEITRSCRDVSDKKKKGKATGERDKLLSRHLWTEYCDSAGGCVCIGVAGNLWDLGDWQKSREEDHTCELCVQSL